MKISNPEMLKNLYECKKHTAEYLEKHNFFSVGNNGKVWYFADTQELQQFLPKVPFWIALLDW